MTIDLVDVRGGGDFGTTGQEDRSTGERGTVEFVSGWGSVTRKTVRATSSGTRKFVDVGGAWRFQFVQVGGGMGPFILFLFHRQMEDEVCLCRQRRVPLHSIEFITN